MVRAKCDIGCFDLRWLSQGWSRGVDGLNSARDVVVSPDGKNVYATAYNDHAVCWFERNATTGALTYGGVLKDGFGGVDGLSRAYGVAISTDGLNVYVAGQNDHAVSWFERNATSGALTYGGKVKDGVNGVDGLNWSLNVLVSPDNKNVYATGIFDMAVSWYERNATGGGALHYGGVVKDGVNGVDGLLDARSLALSANGKHLYATGESDHALSWYERNASTGALSYGGMLKDGVNGVDGLRSAQDVQVSPDGKNVYVVGESDNSISWFTRDHATGALSYGPATGSSYTLSSDDLGATITVRAIYTDGGGFSEQIDSHSSLQVELPVMPSPGLIHMGNIKLWLDANHTSLSESAWTDRSSYSNHATKHGTPSFISSAQNGLPVMRYSGSNGEYHSFASIQDIRTVFWVLKNNGGYWFILGDKNKYDFHAGPNEIFLLGQVHIYRIVASLLMVRHRIYYLPGRPKWPSFH